MINHDEQIATLLTKGVAEIFPNAAYLEQLLKADKKLSIYVGFDPTAPTLHIGHAIQLRKLRQFQDLGHKIIFLIGDFTAMIGDPTDKLATRSQLTKKEVKANLARYKKQAASYIRFSGKNKAEVKFNSKWLSKLKFEDIIKITSLVTVDQLLKRDMFVKRNEEGKAIYLHEFLYPIMQGYDSVAMEVDGEIGGSDQTFNMLTGRTLLKQMKNKEKFVLTLKLLEDGTGKKMSKSEGNMITLEDKPEDMYGKVMSFPDSFVPIALELCTDLSIGEVKRLMENTSHPKELKMRLALEVVKAAYGEKEAMSAQYHFIQLFQKGEIPENISTFKRENIPFVTFFINEKFISSRSELRRLVEGGAVENIDKNQKLSWIDTEGGMQPGTYRIGKTRYFKILD